MSNLWADMGFIRWPLAFSLLAMVSVASWSAFRLFRRDATPGLRIKAWVDAVLFWGGFAVITGILGTLVGITVTAGSIRAAGSVSQGLMWGGIQVAMTSVIFGLLILALAALLWFVLQLRWRFLLAAAAGPAHPGR